MTTTWGWPPAHPDRTGRWDWRRLPYETRKAIEAGGLLPEQLEPGLSMRRDGDELVVSVRDGRVVGRIAMGFLAEVDLVMLRAAVAEQAGALPAFADALAILDAGDWDRVVCDPASDYVVVTLEGSRRVAVHRETCVPGWPADDERGSVIR